MTVHFIIWWIQKLTTHKAISYLPVSHAEQTICMKTTPPKKCIWTSIADNGEWGMGGESVSTPAPPAQCPLKNDICSLIIGVKVLMTGSAAAAWHAAPEWVRICFQSHLFELNGTKGALNCVSVTVMKSALITGHVSMGQTRCKHRKWHQNGSVSRLRLWSSSRTHSPVVLLQRTFTWMANA